MLTALALATILQTSGQSTGQSSSSSTGTTSQSGTTRGGTTTSGAPRSGRQANRNLERNGRRFGSLGVPTANAIVDGEQLQGGVIVVSNHVFVEMLPTFQRLGVRTTYRRGDRKIEAFTPDRGVSFTIGDTYAMMPGRTKLDAAPMMRGDKVFIPLRAIGQAFRADVRWDKGTRTAYITSSSKTQRNGATGADPVGGTGAGSTSGGGGTTGGTGGGTTGGSTGV